MCCAVGSLTTSPSASPWVPVPPQSESAHCSSSYIIHSVTVLLPGTMIAGLSVLCCGKPNDITKRQSLGSCSATVGVGALQLVMVACFMIGWAWSAIWGVSLVGMSGKYITHLETLETEAKFS